MHLRTRDYQPEIGRFVKPDIFPGFLTQPLTLNRYGYVSNNPTNLVDPLGLVGERSSFSDQLKAIPAESLERLNKATSYAGGILGFAGLVLGVAAGVAAAGARGAASWRSIRMSTTGSVTGTMATGFASGAKPSGSGATSLTGSFGLPSHRFCGHCCEASLQR